MPLHVYTCHACGHEHRRYWQPKDAEAMEALHRYRLANDEHYRISIEGEQSAEEISEEAKAAYVAATYEGSSQPPPTENGWRDPKLD